MGQITDVPCSVRHIDVIRIVSASRLDSSELQAGKTLYELRLGFSVILPLLRHLFLLSS